MVVVRESLVDSQLPHHLERNAVDQAVPVVVPALIECESTVETRSGLLNYGNAEVLPQALDSLGSQGPQLWASSAEEVQNLAEYLVGGDDLSVRQSILCSNCRRVKLVVAVQQRDPVAGVGEGAGHGVFFDVPYK